MSISEKLERRVERPPLPSPDDARPGYSQPDAVDPSGYSLSDRSGPTGVHPVPGGALGEAGAAWTDQDFGPAVGLTRQHAIRPVDPGAVEGISGQHALCDVPSVYAGDSARSERSSQTLARSHARSQTLARSHAGSQTLARSHARSQTLARSHARSQTLARSPARLTDTPLEYTADRDRTPRSDSEVYRDVYGPRMPERGRDPGAD